MLLLLTLAKYINKILQLFGLCSGKIYSNTVHPTVVAVMVRYITSWNSILRIFSPADHIKLMVYLKICQSVNEHWNKYFITGILFFVLISNIIANMAQGQWSYASIFKTLPMYCGLEFFRKILYEGAG